MNNTKKSDNNQVRDSQPKGFGDHTPLFFTIDLNRKATKNVIRSNRQNK